MKRIILVLAGATFSLAAFAAESNDTQGETAARLAGALGAGKIVACVTAGKDKTDRLVVLQNTKGDLRMKVTFKGGMAGTYDSDTDSIGECGGLSVKANAEYDSIVLDDNYSDCERGNWGYRLIIPESALDKIAAAPGATFTAKADPITEGTADGATLTLVCSVKNRASK